MPRPNTPASVVLDGRYRLLARLGRGGMADVRRAVDLVAGREVAIKMLHSDLAVDAGRSIARERKILEALGHPAVVKVLGAAVEPAHPPYLVLDLIHGRDLAIRIADGPLAPEEVRRVGLDVAAALAHLEQRGLVHCDVKPANIVVRHYGSNAMGGTATLVDFGIATFAWSDAQRYRPGVVGTAAYLSPEQVAGSAVGPRADVYSLGLVLIEALTGVRAFPGGSVDAALAHLRRSPALPETASRGLTALLARMTAIDPQLRPSAADVVVQLRALTGRMTAAPSAEADFTHGNRPSAVRPRGKLDAA